MITTVLGTIEKSELGVTSAHEHMFIDMLACVKNCEQEEEFKTAKINPRNRYAVWSNPYNIKDNAVMDSYKIALKELKLFKKAGGNTIVDCTLREIGRNPKKLKKLSKASGVNIVMGCGHYYDAAHPQWVRAASVDELCTEMVSDLTVGADNTDIKAGFIGEIGTSATITESEKKVLHAAGKASAKTGKAIHVHTSLFEENGYEVIDTLVGEGAEPERICIDHIDVKLRKGYVLDLLKKGAYVEFDNFGKEFYVPTGKLKSLPERFVYDLERAEFLADLVKEGYEDKILISNDICLKTMLTHYGGNGYAHLLKGVKDMLVAVGLSERQLEKLYVENIGNFLD